MNEGLNGVWGTSAQMVYAAGGSLWTNAVVYRYDGSSWISLGGVSGVFPGLSNVWGTAEDDVWAIAFGMQVLHFDGSSWEFTDIVDEPLFGIWGSSPTDVFVVGGGIWQHPLIMHYSGDGWLPMSGAAGEWLNAVWGSSATDVYAVGEKAVNHYNGYLWSPMNMGSISLSDVTLEDVWGSSGTDVYAVGDTILHYDGTSWSKLTSGTTDFLTTVWGSSRRDVFVGGWYGELRHLTSDLPTQEGGSCPRPVTIYCQSTLFGSNVNQPSNYSNYSCAGRNDTGQEVYYRLHNPVYGQATVRLTPREADLDLIVVGADGTGGCDPAGQCLGSSQTNGATALEQVTFDIAPGETYYFIVDGYSGALSGYTIEVDCVKQ